MATHKQCCKFPSGTGIRREGVFPGSSGGHFEQLVDETILTPDAMPVQPPHLALPNYVHRLIALNRSPRSLEFAKPLLGVHAPFDRAMVLLDDVNARILSPGGLCLCAMMLCELSAAVRSLNALTQRNRHLHTLSYLSLPQTKLSAASVPPVPL